MMNKSTLPRSLITWCIVFLFILGIAGCQTVAETQSGVEETQPLVSNEPLESESTLPIIDSPTDQVVPTSMIEDTEPDPAAIQAAWQSSPHADTFILDLNGQNNTCARCHAPINWSPSMDELPESCFACKFELEAPPPTKGRVITTGEFGGLAGFQHVYDRLGVTFRDKDQARQVLDLVRYATAHNQLTLTDDELRFVAMYPAQARTILTGTTP